MNEKFSIAVLIVVGILSIVYLFFSNGEKNENESAEDRLMKFVDEVKPSELIDKMRLTTSFRERMFGPLFRKITGALERGSKGSQIDNIEKQIISSGINMKPGTFLFFKIGSLFIGGIIGLLVITHFHMKLIDMMLILVIGVIIGYMFPGFYLKNRTKKRKSLIAYQLPGALDILKAAVDSGATFEDAMQRLVEYQTGPLAEEFKKVLNDIRIGIPRSEAMSAMSVRNQIPALTEFLEQIIQSEGLGVSIGEAIKQQAEEMRRQRKQAAEASAQKAPVKMLLPMVGCILPTIFLVLLGPAVIEVMQEFGSKI